MTDEEKNILIEDICARLPYGVMCRTKARGWKGTYKIVGCNTEFGGRITIDCEVFKLGDEVWLPVDIVPLLRPLAVSNMTMDERYEYGKFINGKVFEYANATAWTRWLNEHHFDYNGLIEKGLAEPAPEGTYNIK